MPVSTTIMAGDLLQLQIAERFPAGNVGKLSTAIGLDVNGRSA
jgi:hypothetical protein